MKACTRCHANPYAGDEAHLLLADKLGAGHSVWTDGHWLRAYAKLREAKAKPDIAVAPHKQIEALKGQLAEMQKTLAALEASLAKPKEENEDEKK
jgi:cob(I)alamin adenosyltransferase